MKKGLTKFGKSQTGKNKERVSYKANKKRGFFSKSPKRLNAQRRKGRHCLS